MINGNELQSIDEKINSPKQGKNWKWKEFAIE